MTSSFELLLFSTSPETVRAAVDAGVAGIVVDWEHRGKRARQAGADTEINHDTPADLERVRAASDARVICRLNGYGPHTPAELERAIACGADEVLLPMVRTVEEVASVCSLARGRCGVGMLVETVAAVACAPAFARLPLARVYVGLNDLAIARGTPSIFTALVDGTVEDARRPFRLPFGVGGLTRPEGGAPIPCRLLIGEMARLGCAFSFLRRSFHRDMRGRDLALEVPRLRAALDRARRRTRAEVARDREELERALGVSIDHGIEERVAHG
jgi:hypothetical protein